MPGSADEGVTFKSHLDGSRFFLSPAEVVDIQNVLDSDIQMVLDYFALPRPAASRTRTGPAADLRLGRAGPGALSPDDRAATPSSQSYRAACTRTCAASRWSGCARSDFEGYAIGGLSVGESRRDFERVLSFLLPLMPPD